MHGMKKEQQSWADFEVEQCPTQWNSIITKRATSRISPAHSFGIDSIINRLDAAAGPPNICPRDFSCDRCHSPKPGVPNARRMGPP